MSPAEQAAFGLPLLCDQEGWLLNEESSRILDRPRSSANLVLCLAPRTSLERGCLETALNEVVNRHSSLRVAILPAAHIPAIERRARVMAFAATSLFEPGMFYQRVQPDAALTLSVQQSSAGGQSGRWRVPFTLLQQYTDTSFDLEEPPLVRAHLVNQSNGSNLLIVVFHYLIADDWSLRVFERDLHVCYENILRGARSHLPPPRISFPDFTFRQIELRRTGQMDLGMRYWSERWSYLAGSAIPLVDLPAAAQRMGGSTGNLQVALSKGFVDQFLSVTARLRVTPFVVWMAGLLIALWKYSGKSKVAAFANFANRGPATIEAIGRFAGTHVVGIDIDPESTVRSVIEETHLEVRRSARHSHISSMEVRRYFGCKPPETNVVLDVPGATPLAIPFPPSHFVSIPTGVTGDGGPGLHLTADISSRRPSLIAKYCAQTGGRKDVSSVPEELLSIVVQMEDYLDAPLHQLTACSRSRPLT